MTKLTNSRLQAGIWKATVVHAGESAPVLTATHDGCPLSGLQCDAGAKAGLWRINLAIPSRILGDGLQTIVIRTEEGTTLGSLAILSGEALADDIRAEIGLLRSELDLLKAAFRKLHHENQG